MIYLRKLVSRKTLLIVRYSSPKKSNNLLGEEKKPHRSNGNHSINHLTITIETNINNNSTLPLGVNIKVLKIHFDDLILDIFYLINKIDRTIVLIYPYL